MKSQHQLRVEEFMRKAGQDVPTEPTIPPEEVRKLRVALPFEEICELAKDGYAIEIVATFSDGTSRTITDPGVVFSFYAHQYKEPNLEQIADAHADISVTNVGGLSACGIHDVELLKEVDRSNLPKFEVPQCPNHGDMMQHSAGGEFVCIEQICVNGPICGFTKQGPYRREDGKWIKGPDWQPPDIVGVLESQGKSPNIICKAPGVMVVEDDGDIGLPAATDDGVSYGRAECGNCRTPLSDEVIKRLRNNRTTVITCPECQQPVILKDVVYA